MAWVAFDRAARLAERAGDGAASRWRAGARAVRADVLRHGLDARRGHFVQAYGSESVDASLLLLPLVGFLPATDPRVRATVAEIERRLMPDGLVRRYEPDEGLDGLAGGEGAFLLCSFWLVEVYAAQGRLRDAEALFERLLSLRNDVGLLAEEHDLETGRSLGNFPQAFSHVGVVNAWPWHWLGHEGSRRDGRERDGRSEGRSETSPCVRVAGSEGSLGPPPSPRCWPCPSSRPAAARPATR